MAEKGTMKQSERVPGDGHLRALTITQQASTGSLVQTDQTQVLDDPERRATRGTLDVLSNLTLNLQANFDDFQRVCENLSDQD